MRDPGPFFELSREHFDAASRTIQDLSDLAGFVAQIPPDPTGHGGANLGFFALISQAIPATDRWRRPCGIPVVGALPVKSTRILWLVSFVAVAAVEARAADSLTDATWQRDSSSSAASKKNSSKSAAASKSPAVMSKMTDGTKRFVNSTKSMLMPKKPTTTRKGGVTAVHKKNPPPEQQGFFKSLFQPAPKPQQPRTIKEWMALKQIHP